MFVLFSCLDVEGGVAHHCQPVSLGSYTWSNFHDKSEIETLFSHTTGRSAMSDEGYIDTEFISVLDFAFLAVKALCDAICKLTGSLRKEGTEIPPFLGPVHKSLCDIRTLLAEQDDDQNDIGEEDLLKLVAYLERLAKVDSSSSSARILC